MRHWIFGSLVLLAGCGSSAASGEEPLDAASVADALIESDAPFALPGELIDWVAGSGWVFEATVTRLKEATEEPPPWDPEGHWDLERMIVVEVNAVARAPESAMLVPGSEHTVILPEPPALAVGTRVYFFVSWLSAGESWVFLQIGQLARDAIEFSELAVLVEEIEDYLADRAIYERLLAADRVVEATVLDTRRLPGPEVDNLPVWWEADVEVISALRGPASIDRPVRFDGAQSYCCYLRPKLEVGEQAILALFPDTASGAEGAGFLIADPLDKWPVADRARLDVLLQAPPVPPL